MSNDLILPSPAKALTKKRSFGLQKLYLIKMMDVYLEQCDSTSGDDLTKFLIFFYNSLHKKQKELLEKAKGGKWEVGFGPEDVYLMGGSQAKFAVAEACEKLQAAARAGMSLARIFWDKNENSLSMKKFAYWLAKKD